MAVNLQHLRTFHAVAIEGSISRAARRLNVSQPTLSQQLKALEERHGVILFDGRKPPLRLSTLGRDLFAISQRLFAASTDVDELLGEARGLDASVTLRIASDSPPYAARLIAGFHRRHVDASISLRVGNARDFRPQQPAGLSDPREHRRRRNRQAIQLRNQLRATRKRQQLTVGQMHRQGTHVRAILNEFAHTVGKSALVQLPAGATQLPRAMFGDLVTRNRNVEHLPLLVHLRISREQRRTALRAVRQQWILDHHVHRACPFEGLARASELSTRFAAGGYTQ